MQKKRKVVLSRLFSKLSNMSACTAQSLNSKKAQITVFIIIGVIIFFAAIMFISLAKEIQTKELSGETQRIFSNLASKEPWRLYIDDCLTDELAKGLVILGQQGGLWADQPGGYLTFSTLTGVGYPTPTDRLAYGITDKQHLPPNQYPCLLGKPEAFCEYKYPNSSFSVTYDIKFGERKLSQQAIEQMLGDFLVNKTATCISDFVKANYTLQATADIKKMEMDLEILDEGIKIKASVPLKVGTREVFTQASEFDLFYPTYFKRFLDVAVTRPLGFDDSYLDFNYTAETLKQNSFQHQCYDDDGKVTICTKYLNQPRGFTVKTEVKTDALPNGDDIYKFTASNILKNQEYLFQFARQNRPPALDYVSRDGCLADGYDYLVVPQAKDKEKQLINISLFALDPDEENVTYEFEKNSLVTPLVYDSQDKKYGLDRFVVDGSYLSAGWYNITGIAKDKFGKQDNQTVRVLVDRPIKVKVNVTLPYPKVNNEVGLNSYVISKEDPFFVKVDLPTKSLIENKQPNVTLSYDGLVNSADSFQYQYPQTGLQPCFSFPGLFKNFNCGLKDFSLDTWLVGIKSPYYNITKNSNGKIKVDYGLSYCGTNDQKSSAEATVNVVACIPYEQEGFPYPYIEGTTYYKTKQTKDKNGNIKTTTEDIDPFLANHSCCSGDINTPSLWKLEDKGVVCFEKDGGESCLSNSPFPTKIKLQGTCDGIRGNVCGEIKKIAVTTTDVLKCGTTAQGCSANLIDSTCAGKEPYSYGNGAWCNVGLGCKSTCTSEIVDSVPLKEGFGKTAVQTYGKTGQYVCGCGKDDVAQLQQPAKPCYNLKEGGEGVCDEKVIMKIRTGTYYCNTEKKIT